MASLPKSVLAKNLTGEGEGKREQRREKRRDRREERRGNREEEKRRDRDREEGTEKREEKRERMGHHVLCFVLPSQLNGNLVSLTFDLVSLKPNGHHKLIS